MRLLDGEVVKLYETVCELKPRDEDNLNQLFMAYIRNKNYRQAQQAAVKLLKLTKNEKYVFWNIVTNYLQYKYDNVTGTDMLLKLSCKMLEKLETEGKLQTTEELKFYVIMLQDLKDYGKIKTLLDKHKETYKIKSEFNLNYLKNLVDMNDLASANDYSESLIVSSIETGTDADWKLYETYLECQDKLGLNDEKVLPFCDANEKVGMRGLLLFRLKYHFQKNTLTSDLIINFIKLFSTKSTLFNDIQEFLQIESLKETMKSYLVNELAAVGSISESNYKYKINLYKLLQKIDSSLLTVDDLFQDYLAVIGLIKNEPTDRNPGDEIILVICDIMAQSKDAVRLETVINCISILIFSLKVSKFNYNLIMKLVQILLKYGLVKESLPFYKNLDIKSLLQESCSYVLLEKLIPSAIVVNDDELIQNCFSHGKSIVKMHQMETLEMICQAFKFSTYSKIDEFINFRLVLDKSLYQSILDVDLELLKMKIILQAQKHGVNFDIETFKNLDLENLVDNRDMSILNSGDFYTSFDTRTQDHLRNRINLLNTVKSLMSGNREVTDDVKQCLLDLKSNINNFSLASELLISVVTHESISAAKDRIEKYFESIKDVIDYRFFGPANEFSLILHVLMKFVVSKKPNLKHECLQLVNIVKDHAQQKIGSFEAVSNTAKGSFSGAEYEASFSEAKKMFDTGVIKNLNNIVACYKKLENSIK